MRLLAEGLVTQGQLDEALRQQSVQEDYAPLGHILVTQNIVTRDQLLTILERHRRSSKLGDLLLKSGDIDQPQLDAALNEQRRSGLALGEALVQLGLVSEERLRVALCRQLHIRFFSLDTIIIDPSLRNLVNEKFAIKTRTVPLARVGNLLVVAMDDPTQTSVIDDLQRTTGLKIEVVTSTAAHITRALERLYRVETPPEDRHRRQHRRHRRAVRRRPIYAPSNAPAGRHRRRDRPQAAAGGHRPGRLRHPPGNHQQPAAGALSHRRDAAALQPGHAGRRPQSRAGRGALAHQDHGHARHLGAPPPAGRQLPARVAREGRVVPMDFRVSIIPGYYGENAVIRLLDPRRAPSSIEQLNLAPPITERLQSSSTPPPACSW